MSIFRVQSDGVYEEYSSKDNKKELAKICGNLDVLARTRDGSGERWGKLLRWRDVDAGEHAWVMPMSTASYDVLARLTDGGLEVESGESVIDYIKSRRPRERMTTVDQTGWYDDAFILPDITIQPDGDTSALVYATEDDTGKRMYGTSGTLAYWQENIGALCSGNSRLLFSVSCALSGPTLALLGEESGGFHLYGQTSQGKSTCAMAGGSVWGGGGKNGFLKSWRATSNGLELTAAAHNDLFLPLDELSQLDPRDALHVAYMLSGGESEQRMNMDGSGQKKKTWRLQFLSTGEETMDQLASKANGRTRGGMEVRMANVPIDAGKEMGAFEQVNREPTASAFAMRIKAAANTHYGVVGREFLRFLVDCKDDCAAMLKRSVRQFEHKYVPPHASSEVTRVVRRFAVVAADGELATFLQLTGWDDGEAEQAAEICFQAWLAQRGAGAGEGHDAEQQIRQVRHFIEVHGASRFTHLSMAAKLKGEEQCDDREQVAGHSSYQRAGYSKSESGGLVYYFETEVFRVEVVRGYDHKQVLGKLKKAGHLLVDSNRLDKNLRLGTKLRRFYAVKESVLDNNG